MEVRLYRGKRKDNGEWVYGYYYKWLKFSYIICENTDSYALTTYEVIPESVGQHTGTSDKNDKQMFCGDIVRFISFLSGDYFEDEEGVIVLKDAAFQIKHKVDWDKSPRYHRIGEVDKWQDMNASGTITYAYEVIGNICDNPELLEVS